MKPLISNAISRRVPPAINRVIGGSAGEVPADFLELTDCLPLGSDRQWGYFGEGRFVAFRYEPRAEDVMWRDERSFGIATGAWQTFLDQMQPLADLYAVNVGTHNRAATDVLVLDRAKNTAYFASRKSAEAYLAHRQGVMPLQARR